MSDEPHPERLGPKAAIAPTMLKILAVDFPVFFID
jgi:hypothetical protein